MRKEQKPYTRIGCAGRIGTALVWTAVVAFSVLPALPAGAADFGMPVEFPLSTHSVEVGGRVAGSWHTREVEPRPCPPAARAGRSGRPSACTPGVTLYHHWRLVVESGSWLFHVDCGRVVVGGTRFRRGRDRGNFTSDLRICSELRPDEKVWVSGTLTGTSDEPVGRLQASSIERRHE